MAAIVRFSRFGSRVLALRSVACNSLYREFSSHQGVRGTACTSLYAPNGSHVLARWYCAAPAAVDAPTKTRQARRVPQPSVSGLDGHLKELDGQVRRWGRVDRESVNKLLQLVSQNGKVSTQQAIMVLRCTGSLLVKESSAERNALFEEACNVLKSVGAEVNIQVYNAMLRTKLENKQPFSPMEIIEEMESVNNLIANRITYQLIISQFCENGDMEGASTILEHMKSQNLPVNEFIFNSLVKGHMKQGDLAGAKAILASMSESGMNPTADTYQTLMCGLAEKGDIDGIKQCLKDAENASVKFFGRHLYNVIVSLTAAGQDEAIDEILNYISQKIPQYNQDALNCMFQLVAEGKDDMAFRVFNKMDHSAFEGQQRQSPGAVLLRILIIKGRPIEKVLAVRKQFEASNLWTGSIEEVANMALRYQHSEYTLQVLEKMKEEGCDLKQHFFWPVLRDASERKDIKGSMNTIASLVKCMEGKNETLAGTIFRWAFKPLLQNGESLETLLNDAKDTGLEASEVEMIRVAGLASTGKLEEVAKLIDSGVKFSPAILKAELVNGFYSSNGNAAELIKVIQVTDSHVPNTFIDARCGILLGILKRSTLTKDLASNLTEEWAKTDLKLLQNFEVPIKRELKRVGVEPETIEKLNPLFIDPSKDQIPTEELKKASIEQTESWLEKAKQERLGRTGNLERSLLMKYCRAGLVDKAEALRKTLDERGAMYGPDVLRSLGNLAARDKNNLEEALALKRQLEAQHPEFVSYASLVLHIAKLQLKSKRFEDVLDALRNFSSRNPTGLQKSGFSDGYMLSDLCRNLLNTCSEEYGPYKTRELCDALFENGFVKDGTFSLICEVMDAYIKKGDAKEVVSVLEEYVTKLNKAPSFSNVFQLLIQQEDATLLERAVDLVSAVHGEANVLLHVAVSFVECNRHKQARKVLMTENLTAVMKPLVEGCERFINLDKEKELEQLVEITKTLPKIDREEMLFQLMRLYAKRKDAKKMMEVFSLLDEERIRPRARTLRYLAKVLENLGQPIPFDVPSAEQALQGSPRPASSTMEAEAQKALEAKDIAKVMEIKAQMDAKGEELSVKFAVDVARFLFSRKDVQLFRKFCLQLADSGDTDSLLAVRKLTMSKMLDRFVHQRLFIAYINRNKADELLDYLKEKPDELQNYLTMHAFNLLNEKKPELIPTLISVIESHLEKSEIIFPASLLYNYYMLSGQVKEVENLLQKYPSLKDRVRLSYVCLEARRQQKEDIIQKVIELHPSDNPRRRIVPYNQLLLLKCDLGDASAALECYQSALAAGLSFDDFWVRTLQSVASLIEGSGQQVPWQPGMLEKRAASEKSSRRKDISSSSDSDSDSDIAEVTTNPKF